MNDELIEALSDKVHQAWMAEKIRQGFADHTFREAYPGDPRRCVANGDEPICTLPADKHHTDMLPYAELGESTKEYDRATVRAMLNAISETGYLIVPNMQAPV